MTEIILVLITGLVCILCFYIGAKVGQTVHKGLDIKLPSVNPLKAIREAQEKKEAKAEQDKVNTIMENIERYDGTDRGQKDVG